MKIVAKDNGLFVLRGSVKSTKVSRGTDVEQLELASREDGNFMAKLFYADYLMEHSKIQEACQVRLDASIELIESIDDEDDIELDLSDSTTSAAVKLMAQSSIDHYMICDFEMAISLAETVLELNPEDTDGVMEPLAFCYAMLGDSDAVKDIVPFIQETDEEKELLYALAAFKSDSKASVSEKLRSQLIDKNSDLSHKTEHLWLAIPGFREILN